MSESVDVFYWSVTDSICKLARRRLTETDEIIIIINFDENI